jgi:hypothetical protein
MRTALFWVITRRVVVISYRRFGKAYRSKVGLIGFPQTSVRNYHYLLLNNPEERNSELLIFRGGSPKSCIICIICTINFPLFLMKHHFVIARSV